MFKAYVFPQGFQLLERISARFSRRSDVSACVFQHVFSNVPVHVRPVRSSPLKSARLPRARQGSLNARDQFRRGDVEDASDFQKDDKVRALNPALNETDERAIQPGRFRKLFLRHALSLPGFAHHVPEGAFRPGRRLDLRTILSCFSGRQVNILRSLP